MADTDYERHASRLDLSPDLSESGESPVELTANSRNGNPSSRSPLFWQLSHPQDVSWFVPPLVGDEEAADPNTRLLKQYTDLLNGSPHRAWLLQWNYRTRAVAAARELNEIERLANSSLESRRLHKNRETERIDRAIETLDERRATLDSSLSSAYGEIAEAAAVAGLTCDQLIAAPPPGGSRIWPRARRSDGAEVTEATEVAAPTNGITPSVVEEALYLQTPDLAHIAGASGVSPVAEGNILSRVLSFFMQLLAPFVCGFMLALCLGTLVGILGIETLERADSAPQLLLAAALGFVIVYLIGEIFANGVGALARALEMRESASAGHRPGLRGALAVAAALLCVALFFGGAEIIAEACGIRELHQQQISRRERYVVLRPGEAPKSDNVPFLIYLAIGTLISGPYLFYKTTKAWGEHDANLREAWLLHRQQSWLEAKRQEPAVQKMFRLAYVIEHLSGAREETVDRLRVLREERAEVQEVKLDEATEARFNNARAAAVGEAARLQQELETSVSSAEPDATHDHYSNGSATRMSGASLRSNGAARQGR